MSIIIHQETAPESDFSSCITATVEPRFLGQLREALGPIQGLHVVVSSALAWDGGRELVYRGSRVLVDREVCRVEIGCPERDVERVMRAVRRVVALTDGQSLRASAPREAFTSGVRPRAAEMAV